MSTYKYRCTSHNARLNRRNAMVGFERQREASLRQVQHMVIDAVGNLDTNDLGGFCRQSLQYLVTKLKASRALMLVEGQDENFFLAASQGYEPAELQGIGYSATFSPFLRKLIKGQPFISSHCKDYLDERNSNNPLFKAGIVQWIPLVITSEERVIGIIGLDKESANDYQRSIAQAWAEFAPRSLQNTIDNLRLLNKTFYESRPDDAQEKLRVCLHTIRSMANLRYRHLDDLYNGLLEILNQIFHAKRLVMMVRSRAGNFHTVRQIGLERQVAYSLQYTPGNDIFTHLLSTGRVFELQLASVPKDSPAFALAHLGLNYFVPFVTNDDERQIMGFAGLAITEAPTGYHALISRHLSSIAAMMLSNSVLNSELQDTRARHEHQINKLQMLYDVGRALSVIDNRTELLRKILGHATDIVQAEKGSVMLLNDNHRLEVNVVKGIDEEVANKILHGEIHTTSLALGEGIAGTVAQTGQPMLINDVAGLDDGAKKKKVKFVTSKTSHVSSILCVPLRAHNEVIGVINITNKKQGKEFTEDDKRIVEQVADQAAVAIHNARLYELAITDSLTKVFVRHQLFLRLDDELKRLSRARDRKCVTVIMIDIDFFKSINDRFGHPYGDKVLIAVTKTVRNSLRAVDSICRYGGEEFCMILPDTDMTGGKIVARRITRLLEKLDMQSDNGTQVRVSVSGGIASCRNYEDLEPDNPTSTAYRLVPNKLTVSDLIKQADMALYWSKQHGRNKFTSFDDIRCLRDPLQVCICNTKERSDCVNMLRMKAQLEADAKAQNPHADDDSAESDDANSAHNVKYESDMRR